MKNIRDNELVKFRCEFWEIMRHKIDYLIDREIEWKLQDNVRAVIDVTGMMEAAKYEIYK